jgi:hypothetical protein
MTSRGFSGLLGALIPLLLPAGVSSAQGAWNEAFVGFSMVAPDPHKGLSLAFERHTGGPASPFADASVFGGAIIVMGGVRLRAGDRSRLSPFAHLQGGVLTNLLDTVPVVSCGAGIDFGGLAASRIRIQLDGIFTTEGGAVLRVSVGLPWPTGR